MSAPLHDLTGDAWHARLELDFERRGACTRLTSRRHHGPLRVQRPFYPEGAEVCHAYLLHPPGGVVGGDELRVDVAVRGGAHAVITTPAAGKFYRSGGPSARQTQRLRVASGAALEWLPQENIVFDGACVDLRTQVELESGARFIGWEILCLGRSGAGERFRHGGVRQRLEVWRDGQPLYVERARYEQGADALVAPWGLADQPVSASLLCVQQDAHAADAVRTAVSPEDGLFGVTQLDDVLVCRYLGAHADDARRCFERAWALLRPAVLHRAACAPRIWAT